MPYRSTKTFGHELGLSCAFRQWRANHSHCSKLHGYALSIKFTFEADELDDKNWVMDFGGFKELKERLQYWFDHTTVVARDDPERERFKRLHAAGVIDMREMENVGCEKFAEFMYFTACEVLRQKLGDRVKVVSCEVAEHGANSAIYIGE